MTRFLATTLIFVLAAAMFPALFLCLVALALWRCFR